VDAKPPPTGAAQNFVSAANALAQAESDYFDQIQAASDESHLLLAGAIYVGRGGNFKSISAELLKRDDFSKAKQLRMALMTQLQNYAQQVQAITTTSSGTWVSDDAKSAVTDVTKLLSDASAAKISTAESGIIQTAVTDIAQAIINSMTTKELATLSQEADKPIAELASFISQDNINIEQNNFATGLAGDQNTAMMAILNFIYTDKGVNAAERYSALTQWMAWKPVLVTKATDIAAALKKLQQANDALAAKQEISAGSLASEAFQLAQQAFQAAKPSK
jgi:hypothetical protein